MSTVNLAYSDTTAKNGILQECEFWTGLGDGAITGDTTLIKVITARVNAAFDRLVGVLFSTSGDLKWDDNNNTDLPIGTFNITSGQADYTILTDANSLDILNITGIRILASANGTQYFDLSEMSGDDPNAQEAMSPYSSYTGVPIQYLKRGNTLFLWPMPNYTATNGAKIYFERNPAYFASTDTTKTAGFPRPFQALLPLYASYDWLITKKPDNQMLITRLETQIAKREKALEAWMRKTYPIRKTITTRGIAFR